MSSRARRRRGHVLGSDDADRPRRMGGRRVTALLAALFVWLGLMGPLPAQADLFHPRQEWMRDSTAGLFLHWGMQTAPGYTDCDKWEAAVTNGGWDPDYWVNEAIKLHASYIVLATFHSRLGYARPWPSEIPGSCSTDRDFLGELIDAAKDKGIRVRLYMTDDPQWYWEGLPEGESWFDSEAYSQYKGEQVDLTTERGFGMFSYDNFIEVMKNYPDLAGFWIDNDNEYWLDHDLYEKIREMRPSYLLSNNNEDTPIMDAVSHEQKEGMKPSYDYPAAIWTPLPRLTEGDYKLPTEGAWWYDGEDHEVDYQLSIGRYITNAGASIKSLMAETAMVDGTFPPQQEAFNNFMDGYLDKIWESIDGTYGGGYLHGGLQPGWINDGGFAVTTVKKNNPNQHYVHVTTRPKSGDMVRIRDNGYKVTEVTNVRTGKRLEFHQSGGYLTIMGISKWDQYDTVFSVRTDGRQFIYDAASVTATASASAQGHPGGNVVDGSFRDYWDNDGQLPVELTLDLGEERPVSHLGINQREWSPTYERDTFGRPEDSARIKDYHVYVSDDGQTWGEPVRTGTLESARGVRFIDLGRQHARYVKLEVRSTWAGPQAPRFHEELKIDEMYVAHRYPFRAANPLPLEAEADGNTLSGTARAVRCLACSGGAKVDGLGGGAANAVTFTDVEVAEAGDYKLAIDYTADGRSSLRVSVNGAEPVEIPVTGGSSQVPQGAVMAVPLEAGSNTITFSSGSATGPALDRISIGELPPPSYEPTTSVSVEPAEVWLQSGRQSFEVSATFEAGDYPADDVRFAPAVPEGWSVDGEPVTAARMQPGETLTGSWTITTSADNGAGVDDVPVRASFDVLGRSYTDEQVVRVKVLPPGWVFFREAESPVNTFSGSAGADNCDACSGGQKVRFIGNDRDDYMVFNNVTVDEAGEYELFIDYTVNGTRSFFVSVNGGAGIEVPATGTSWDTPTSTSVTVTLDAGENSIKFYNNDDYAPDLDRIRIAAPGA